MSCLLLEVDGAGSRQYHTAVSQSCDVRIWVKAHLYAQGLARAKLANLFAILLHMNSSRAWRVHTNSPRATSTVFFHQKWYQMIVATFVWRVNCNCNCSCNCPDWSQALFPVALTFPSRTNMEHNRRACVVCFRATAFMTAPCWQRYPPPLFVLHVHVLCSFRTKRMRLKTSKCSTISFYVCLS